jgi:hypothetical protein
MPLRPVGNRLACHPKRRSPVRREIVLGRVEHHLDDALDSSVHRRKRSDVHAEPPRNRGADLLAIESLAFDLARLQNLFGQRLQGGLRAERKAEAFHSTNQPPLVMPNRRQRHGEGLLAPSKAGPISKLMDIRCHLRTLCGEYEALSLQPQ